MKIGTYAQRYLLRHLFSKDYMYPKYEIKLELTVK